MRIWSLPVTKAKALQLSDLLERKLNKEDALYHLFGLFGHEDLFMHIEQASPDEDLRPIVLKFLKDVLIASPACYKIAWEIESRNICESMLYTKRIIKSVH